MLPKNRIRLLMGWALLIGSVSIQTAVAGSPIDNDSPYNMPNHDKVFSLRAIDNDSPINLPSMRGGGVGDNDCPFNLPAARSGIDNDSPFTLPTARGGGGTSELPWGVPLSFFHQFWAEILGWFGW